jgi:chromosome segregation protein
MRERLNALEREHLRWKEDLQTLQEQIHRKTEQLQQGIRRSEELGSRIRRDQDELQRNLVYHDRLRQKVEGLRRDLEEGQSALRGLEEICHSRRKAVRELERGISELDLKIQDIEIRMEHLEAELTGRLELSRQEIEERSRSLSAGDVEKEREELQRLRSALERLGEVNLMAVEQYEELRQRYDYLTGQQEDLEESIRSLQKAIQRINRVSRRRFREAFQALNREFQKVFPLLFEGGEAQLLLTESPDLLEAGVDIVARPPGKRLQNISLLSGGEKALTAVALIFAMIRVKPTPFCLFDEVDAPLDDANIDRFNQMIKELAKDSQFILVTHNKRTMEMADALYGITMESPGVSKLISVRLH